RDALSHSHPNAGIEEILTAGLDLLLERSAKRKGLVAKPRAVPPPSSDPGYVPAHVRRAVWKRDGGRCQFRLASGEICGSTLRVEIDHVIPRALGGPSTVDNCRLACRVHKDRSARRVFGDACMDRFTANPRAGRGAETRGRCAAGAGAAPSPAPSPA
ncbi:MAG TPA: HNH endonuclease signature motif containing protein, partial [Anaeromyxobacter sp.]